MDSSNTWIDYYEVLGVKFDASNDEIKKSYRYLMKFFHPDAYPNATDEEIDLLSNESKIINEAYDCLSDKEKRKEYDSTYEAIKNGTYDSAENNVNYEAQADANYEDVKQNYSEEEAYYAEVMALKDIIEEELKKSVNIINTKNELISDAAFERIDKEAYYTSKNELFEIVNEYIEILERLIIKAEEYELLSEIQIIEDTISFIREALSAMPATTIEARFTLKEEYFKEQATLKLDSLTKRINQIIDEIDTLLIGAYEEQISIDEYTIMINNTLNNANDARSELEELIKIFGYLKMESKNEEALQLLTRFSVKIDTTPTDYHHAQNTGVIIGIKNQMKKLLMDQDKLEKRIKRIASLLDKYPDSSLYDMLFNSCITALTSNIESYYNTINEAQKLQQNALPGEFNVSDYVNRAIQVFENAEKLHSEAAAIYENIEEQRNIPGTIPTLTKSAYAAWNKGEALEQFLEARGLLETYEAMKSILEYDEEFKDLLQTLINRNKNLQVFKDNFNKKYHLERQINPYAHFRDKDFRKKLKKLRKEVITIRIQAISNAIVSVFFAYGATTMSETEHKILTIVLGLIAIGAGTNIIELFPLIAEKRSQINEVNNLYHDYLKKKAARQKYFKI